MRPGDEYQKYFDLAKNIPAGWRDASVILLADSAAAVITGDRGRRVSLTRDRLFYVNRVSPEKLEEISIHYYAVLHEKPEGRITVLYPGGKTWKSRDIGTLKFEEVEPDDIIFKNTGAKEASIRIPNYAPGIIIHSQVKHIYRLPEVLNREFIRGRYHCLTKSVTLSVPAGSEVAFRLVNGENLPLDTSLEVTEKERIYKMVCRNVEKQDPAVGLDNPEAWYAGLHFSVPPSGLKSFSWKALGDGYLSWIARSMTTSPEIRQLAGMIKSADGPSAVKEAFELIQERVRYRADEEGIFGFVPRSAGLILAQGYGDCKEKANLMRMVLREKGIDLKLALIKAGEGDDQLLEDIPTLGAFNHMIVYFESADGHLSFFDPTVWFSSPEKSAFGLLGRKVFLLVPGRSRTSLVTFDTALENRVVTRSTVTQQGGDWRLSGTITLTGLAAWQCFQSLQQYKGETLRPEIGNLLSSGFGISPVRFNAVRFTCDTIMMTYAADFSGHYLHLERGGLLIDLPHLYLKGPAVPSGFSGPRSVRRLTQEDEWVLSAAFGHLERGSALEGSMGSGAWTYAGGVLKRSFIAGDKVFSPEERFEYDTFREALSAFSKSTVWR